MRISLIAVCTAVLAFSGVVAADEPVELSALQMDQITAGSLQLNNGTGGKIVFGGFDNPAPNSDGYVSEILGPLMGFDGGLCTNLEPMFCHPALTRRSDGALATGGHGPSVNPFGNDGPWAATVASPVISCPDCP